MVSYDRKLCIGQQVKKGNAMLYRLAIVPDDQVFIGGMVYKRFYCYYKGIALTEIIQIFYLYLIKLFYRITKQTLRTLPS